MSGSIWSPGIPNSTANADGTYKSQGFNIIANTPAGTVFNITNFAYAPSTGSIEVFINGSKQTLNKTTPDYTETDSQHVQITSALETGDFLEFVAFVGGESTQSAATSASLSAASAVTAVNALAAIQALTPASIPLTVPNGGTGGITALAGFNNLVPTTTKGDLVVDDGTNSIRFPVGTNGSAIIADSTQAAGIRYAAALQINKSNRTTFATLVASDIGKLVNITAPGGTTPVQPIAVSSSLGAGWFVWISSDDTASFADLTIQLTGSDLFSSTASNTILISPGACVGIQCNGSGVFKIFASENARGYVKFQDVRANGVAGSSASGVATPTVGWNIRAVNTVAATNLGTKVSSSSNLMFIPKGTYQYSIKCAHEGASKTKLALVASSGVIILAQSLNHPASQFITSLSGRAVLPAGSYYIQEYYVSAVGNFGTAMSTGDPEVYLEAEFWRE